MVFKTVHQIQRDDFKSRHRGKSDYFKQERVRNTSNFFLAIREGKRQ